MVRLYFRPPVVVDDPEPVEAQSRLGALRVETGRVLLLAAVAALGLVSMGPVSGAREAGAALAAWPLVAEPAETSERGAP